MRLLIAVFLIATVSFAGYAIAVESKAPTYEEVSRKLDDLYRSKSAKGEMELFVKKGEKTRTLTMSSWSKGKDKSLIVITSPARDAGNKTLKDGNNIWNYLSRAERKMRLPPSMMLGSWMGTDFTNDDLVRDVSYEEDFESGPAQAYRDEAANISGWLFEMKVKKGVIGRWKRIDWIVAKDTLLPIEAKYYDRIGRLARTMTFSEVKDLGGKRIPTLLVLKPANERDQETRVRYLKMEFDIEIPDSTFSLSALEGG